ncbi:hypothetical protein PAAG_01188 [Paracoccidioides lutzii Pb01]|uniref:Alpha/beta hydrolase fold-3 domain-containing protein n=1 Tax=Paracoccidioides lutzii (strain ATCC MYA-826 / Pb01) TaxID=502779 RepID=C1GRP3_PARBA|nr:hypothetical protein PAAG_01188 [Paracoccidioides lutzii Pb01]EEH38267.2 hypothetical protein PAAG_01188 [Paracoccidioides lutzii Pb01]
MSHDLSLSPISTKPMSKPQWGRCSILQPVTQSPFKRANVILYLPPGPLFLTSQLDNADSAVDETERSTHQDWFPSPQHALSATTLSTVVTVNYRAGQQDEYGKQKRYYYPGPVHDVLAGFDWIFENLKTERLCVFGRHIGGSLAVMLALTEPRSIAALAAHEPMCDWTSLDDYCLKTDPACEEGVAVNGNHNKGDVSQGENGILAEQTAKKSRRKRKTSAHPPDLVPLLEARRALFRTPDKYPIPVLKVPPKEIISGPDPTRYFQDLDPDLVPPPVNLDSDPEMLGKPVRRRKALSRWPPYGLEYTERPGVKPVDLWSSKPNLPHVRIFVHSNLASDPELDSAPESDVDIFANTAFSAGGEKWTVSNFGVGNLASQVEEQMEPDYGPSTEEGVPTPTSPSSCSRRSRIPRKRTLEADGETILARQGGEMVSLMRNACFWGREKGYAEERVKYVTIPLSSSSALSHDPSTTELGRRENDGNGTGGYTSDFPSVEERAGRYFFDILERKPGEKCRILPAKLNIRESFLLGYAIKYCTAHAEIAQDAGSLLDLTVEIPTCIKNVLRRWLTWATIALSPYASEMWSESLFKRPQFTPHRLVFGERHERETGLHAESIVIGCWSSRTRLNRGLRGRTRQFPESETLLDMRELARSSRVKAVFEKGLTSILAKSSNAHRNPTEGQIRTSIRAGHKGKVGSIINSRYARAQFAEMQQRRQKEEEEESNQHI